MNTHLLRRALGPLLIATTLVLGLPVLRSAPETETVELSAKQMDEALAGKVTNSYMVISKDEVIDMEGRHFAPGKAKAYLKKAKPEKKAAFVFLLADDSLLETARSMVDAFSEYGATVFAVRKIKKGETTVEGSADRDGAAPGQKVVKLVGIPNPTASSSKDAPPLMDARPEHLRPGKLPPRVRYKFVDDKTVVEAAATTEKLLLLPESPDWAEHFQTMVMVLSGAWQHLSDITELKGTKPMITQVELARKVVKLEGRMLADSDQFAKSVSRIRKLLTADGGGTVRALNSAEMNHWWTFIGFDIEEPVFAVESKGGQYTFIVCWLNNRVFCIDELRVLPER